MSRDTPLPLYAPVHILDEPPPYLQLRTYYMDSLFLNQKANNIRLSYWLKYKHSKKEYILCEKIKSLPTFHILEPYSSKDIAPGLSHVISH